MEGEDGLNFDAATLENATTTTARPFSWASDAAYPALAVAAFALVLALSLLLAKRLEVRRASGAKLLPVISSWPASLRVALLPLLAAYALTHALSAVSVYLNTRVANPSTLAYFEALGPGRLSSLSHAHFFAHATMYFLMAVLVQTTRSGFWTSTAAPLLALWAGVFDVFSWWGIKYLSPSYDVLSAICGSAFSISFLVMSGAILHSAFAKVHDSQDASAP